MTSFLGLAFALVLAFAGSTAASGSTVATTLGFRLSTFLTSDILTDTMDSCALKFMAGPPSLSAPLDLQFFLVRLKLLINVLRLIVLLTSNMGPIAHSVERVAVNRKVDGSIPSGTAFSKPMRFGSEKIEDQGDG